MEEQDVTIEQLEAAAQQMQQQLTAANKSVEQYASSMQKVRAHNLAEPLHLVLIVF